MIIGIGPKINRTWKIIEKYGTIQNDEIRDPYFAEFGIEN